MDEPAAFLSPAFLIEGGPHRFVTQVERALWHLGFSDVRNIDGSGDAGGDILALKRRERWAIQCKWKKKGPDGAIDLSGVEEADKARRFYGCERAMIVTNAKLSSAAQRRVDELNKLGVVTDVLDASRLAGLSTMLPDFVRQQFDLRDYQRTAADRINAKLSRDGRALLILATGLGKTVVGGTVIGEHLDADPSSNVLVVAHMKDLVAQLEKAIWRHVPKQVATHLLTGDHRPKRLDGVVCATVESALGAVQHGYRPDLMMVDETHHLAPDGMFSELLDKLDGARQFGVTATPWRGDKYDIEAHFGPAVYKLGIAEGMKRGFLAQVDYRLMLDNLDHDVIRDASLYGYSIKELNRRLFLPERDEEVASEFLKAWNGVDKPRAIVFCETIEHAERFTNLLRSLNPDWSTAACLHAGMPKRERDLVLAEFRRGDVKVLCAVDVLNEGIDVPDVNLIAFLRVTHSRRIFVQQLGRGLRLRKGKKNVVVLDFVSDLRRIAEVLDLKRNLEGETETLEHIGHPTQITFTNPGVQSFMEEWILDAADLATANDDVKLNYPDPFGQVP